MTTKLLISSISLCLACIMLFGCSADNGDITSPAKEVDVTIARTDATEDTTDSTEPTEPPNPHENRPDNSNTVLNKYDTFVRNEITVNNSDYVISDEAKNGIYGVMNSGHYAYYDVGFYVIDLNHGMSFGYNADDYFNPGCTRKAGLALAWFKQAEDARKNVEAGYESATAALTLDHSYYYDGYDYLAGAGYVGRNGYRWYTIRQLLYYLIHESDNTAYNALWRLMGISKYKSLCTKLGIPEHPLDYRRDKLWTPMRPHDIGLIWQEIWNYKDSGSPEAEAMWRYFIHNKYNEIAKVVKDADLIAHKAGSDDYGFHEAGIVVRGENAYAVVAMSTVPLPIAVDDYDVIHMVIERIDPIMKDYYAWYDANKAVTDTPGEPAVPEASNAAL